MVIRFHKGSCSNFLFCENNNSMHVSFVMIQTKQSYSIILDVTQIPRKNTVSFHPTLPNLIKQKKTAKSQPILQQIHLFLEVFQLHLTFGHTDITWTSAGTKKWGISSRTKFPKLHSTQSYLDGIHIVILEKRMSKGCPSSPPKRIGHLGSITILSFGDWIPRDTLWALVSSLPFRTKYKSTLPLPHHDYDPLAVASVLATQALATRPTGDVFGSTNSFHRVPPHRNYHGNPQPSFIGVITHILGVENLHFSWFWGPRVETKMCFQTWGSSLREPRSLLWRDFFKISPSSELLPSNHQLEDNPDDSTPSPLPTFGPKRRLTTKTVQLCNHYLQWLRRSCVKKHV